MSAARKKTLEEVMVEQVAAFSASERPGEIIATNVERMFNEVIKDAFSTHSNFASRVKEEIAKALPANIATVIDLPRYNDLIITALQEGWADAGATGDLLRRAKATMDEVLRDDAIPEFVSLRQLLDSFVDVHQEKATESRWHVPHITFREADGLGGRARYLHVFFDPEPETNYRERHGLRERTRTEMDYGNRLSVHITGNTDRGHEYGEVYAAMLEGLPIGRHFSMHSKWQKLVAALYFGAAKLIIDCSEDDFTYGLD